MKDENSQIYLHILPNIKSINKFVKNLKNSLWLIIIHVMKIIILLSLLVLISCKLKYKLVIE